MLVDDEVTHYRSTREIAPNTTVFDSATVSSLQQQIATLESNLTPAERSPRRLASAPPTRSSRARLLHPAALGWLVRPQRPSAIA